MRMQALLQEITVSPADLQLLNAFRVQREEICAIFSVPLEAVGWPEKTATYASVEQFNIRGES